MVKCHNRDYFRQIVCTNLILCTTFENFNHTFILIIGTTYNPKIRICLDTIQSMGVEQHRRAQITYHKFHGTAFAPKITTEINLFVCLI